MKMHGVAGRRLKKVSLLMMRHTSEEMALQELHSKIYHRHKIPGHIPWSCDWPMGMPSRAKVISF